MPHDGHDEEKETFCKVLSFWSIGILTLVYCVGELAAAVYLGSLTLLSDGFHNLSDVASLYVAYWALKASKRNSGDDMTYGWARTELIGGLINGCALLSLCVYIVLEAIPRFITAIECSTAEGVEKIIKCDQESDDLNTRSKALIFIYVAAAGLAVNTIGTIVFSLSGHGHSHAGGGHNHSHGGEDDHGHSHKKKKKHGHSHGVTPGGEDDHGHSHKKKEKKHGHGHGHSHGDKKKKEEPEKERLLSGHISDDEEDHHHHAPSQDGEEMNTVKNYLEHGKEEKKKKHGHSHDHGHSHGDKKKKKSKIDMNVRAVFLHYLGDMLSSFFVLVTGLLFYFFSPKEDSHSHSHSSASGVSTAEEYLQYLDPTSSLLIVLLILFTTVPMVKRCAVILLQSTPPDVDLNELRRKLHEIPEVHGVHDLHVWQLVDGLSISSVHIVVDYHVNFTDVQHKVKKVFHKMGIHSTAVQPEFVDIQNHMRKDYCETNCVKECEEDWCCKKNAEQVELRSVTGIHSMP